MISGSSALVGGFHYAFAGTVVFVLVGLVALTSLLRAQHVAGIEAEAAPAGAA
jgi:hypothetical protein